MKLHLRSHAVPYDPFHHHPRLFEVHYDHLSHTEMLRRAVHIVPGLIPIWFFFYSPQIILSMRDVWKAVAVCFLTVPLIVSLSAKMWHRPGEKHVIASVLGYVLSVGLMFVMFPNTPSLALTVLAVLAFGDGTATIGGLLFGGSTLPWNSGKTWAGFVFFLVFACPLASFYYWIGTAQTTDPSTALICGSTAAMVGAICESIPSRWNDNIRVGFGSAVTVVATHLLVS